MNNIYTLNISKLNWSTVKHHKKCLPSSEQLYIETFKFNQDKIRSLVGKLLLLYTLKKHAHYQAEVLPCFTYNAYKKPYIDSIQGGFNISHAGDWVVCGYNSQGDIGIDIEKIIPITLSDYKDILTATEYQCTQHDKTFDFFQLWTLKEALMKADGRGFFLSPISFQIPRPYKNNNQIRIADKNWFLFSQLIDDKYYLAVATTTAIENHIQIKQLSLTEQGLLHITPFL